jgi:hypothetical protein
MTEEERDLGTRWFEEVWNKGRRDAIPEMLAPDSVLHEGGQDSVGPDGFYPLFDRMQSAMVLGMMEQIRGTARAATYVAGS